MTPNIASKMCETILIYLGVGIFGVLRRRPFNIEPPPVVQIEQIQIQRRLYWDTNLREMSFTLRRDESFEDTIQPEEITPVDAPKESIPHLAVSLFDENYLPVVKTEPMECDVQTVGGLLLNPASITKKIKQELIDATTTSVLSHHSPTCELSQFVSEGLQDIDDVRNIVIAEHEASHGHALHDVTALDSKAKESDDMGDMPLHEVMINRDTPSDPTTLRNATEQRTVRTEPSTKPISEEVPSALCEVTPMLPKPLHDDQNLSVYQKSTEVESTDVDEHPSQVDTQDKPSTP